jgi:hypothetical protein
LRSQELLEQASHPGHVTLDIVQLFLVVGLEVGPFFILYFFSKPFVVDLGRGTYILNACFGHISRLMNINAYRCVVIYDVCFEVDYTSFRTDIWSPFG